MTSPEPKTGTCGRCSHHRPLSLSQPEWSEVHQEMWLCSHCWQMLADARANHTFVDYADAFDHATDEQLADYLAGRRPGTGAS